MGFAFVEHADADSAHKVFLKIDGAELCKWSISRVARQLNQVIRLPSRDPKADNYEDADSADEAINFDTTITTALTCTVSQLFYYK